MIVLTHCWLNFFCCMSFTGASTSKMEFFPLAAVGIGLAAIGTLLLLFLVMLFRTRLTSASGRRGSRNQQNNSSATSHHHHPLEKPSSLSLTSGLTATTCTANNTNGNNTNNSSATLTNSAGYRPLPQSKIEADANPDIIPGANNYSAGKIPIRKT